MFFIYLLVGCIIFLPYLILHKAVKDNDNRSSGNSSRLSSVEKDIARLNRKAEKK